MTSDAAPTASGLEWSLPRSVWLLFALGLALFLILEEMMARLPSTVLHGQMGTDLGRLEWGVDGWLPPEHFVLLVVARYSENVTWVVEDTLGTLAVLIVNKGGPIQHGVCGGRIMCVSAPNVGRESETYLTAMLRTVLQRPPYNAEPGRGKEKNVLPPQAIPDMVVFSQGNGVQHASTFHSRLQELMDITEKQLVLPLPGYTSMENPIAEDPLKTHLMLLPSFRATFNMTLGYLPEAIEFVAGATFAMSRGHIETLGSRLERQPTADSPALVGRPFVEDLLARLLQAEGTVRPNCAYVNMHKQPCGCMNPFSGYAVERLWPYL
jgi:hypothetical protein